MRGWRGCGLLCALILGFPPIALAQTPPANPPQWPTLEVTVGIANNAATGVWQPIHCLVANETRLPFKGKLQVQADDPRTGLPAVYTRPLEAPTPSRQRHTLWVKLPDHEWEIEVRLLSDDDVVRQSVTAPFTPLYPGSPSVVVIAEKSASPAIVPALGTNPPFELIRATPADLPGRPEGYAAVTAVLVDGLSLHDLPLDRRRALQRWVCCGGTLIVGALRNIDSLGKSFLGEMLPVELTGSEIVPVRAAYGSLDEDARRALFGQFAADAQRWIGREGQKEFPELKTEHPLLVAQGRLRGKAATMWEDREGRPLVAVHPWGEGLVAFIAFDVNAFDIRSWDDLGGFYKKLLASTGAGRSRSRPRYRRSASGMYSVQSRRGRSTYWYTGEPGLDDPMESAVYETAALRVPKLSAVVWFLLAYVLIIGPLEYLVLRRARKPHWTWATFPCTIALFTGGAYLAAGHLKGRECVVNELTILRQHGNEIHANTVFGVYSPERVHRDIGVMDRAAFLETASVQMEYEQSIQHAWSSSSQPPLPYSSAQVYQLQQQMQAQIMAAQGLQHANPQQRAAARRQAQQMVSQLTAAGVQMPGPPSYGGRVPHVTYNQFGQRQVDYGPRPCPPQRQEDKGLCFEDVLINQWSMESFRSGWWAEQGEVVGDLLLGFAGGSPESQPIGTVTNHSPFDFAEAFVEYRARVFRLGRVARGATVEVPLDRAEPPEGTGDERPSLAATPPPGWMPRHSHGMGFEVRLEDNDVFRILAADTRPEVERRKRPLTEAARRAAHDTMPWAPYTPRAVGIWNTYSESPPRFYGWVEGSITPVEVSEESPTHLGLSLYIAPLEVEKAP